jgi:hypothetical protein
MGCKKDDWFMSVLPLEQKIGGGAGGADDPNPTLPISHRVIGAGFMLGLLIAAACLAFAITYLFRFQNDVHSLIVAPGSAPPKTQLEAFGQALAAEHAVIVARIGLRAAALSLGVGFLFLGFSLFLLGVRGSSDLDASAPSGYKLSLTRLAPGMIVILCAAVVVLISAVQPLEFDIKYDGKGNGDASFSGGNKNLPSIGQTTSDANAADAVQGEEKKVAKP